jgi:replication-associated recombination protein RarA
MTNFKQRSFPQIWSDLIFEDLNTKKDLEPYMKGLKVDHLLLHGPIGTGKSTTASIIAGKGKHDHWTPKITVATPNLNDKILNLHYSSCSGIGLFTSKNPIGIVEEIDQFSTHQQHLLRQVMDECIFARFIFTTNHFASVDRAIRSRAQDIHMALPSPTQWLPRAHTILAAEGVQATDAQILSQISAYKGDMRATLRALEDMVITLSSTVVLGSKGPVPVAATVPHRTKPTARVPARPKKATLTRIRAKTNTRSMAPRTVGQILRKNP